MGLDTNISIEDFQVMTNDTATFTLSCVEDAGVILPTKNDEILPKLKLAKNSMLIIYSGKRTKIFDGNDWVEM